VACRSIFFNKYGYSPPSKNRK